VPEQPAIKWVIQKLSAVHDRSTRECGNESLDEFLKKYAGQNQRLGMSQTYVAVQVGSNHVEGYYTISSGSVEFANIPEELRKGVPRYPIPVAHLGRLAVAKIAQGRGLGQLLLLDAMERIVRAADSIGIHAIEVWAKDAAARSFYTKYGFIPLSDGALHLYISLKTVRKLGLV